MLSPDAQSWVGDRSFDTTVGEDDLAARLCALETRLQQLRREAGTAAAAEPTTTTETETAPAFCPVTAAPEIDEFGLDPGFEARLRPGVDALYRRYFRVEVSGIENVPSSGRCLVVSNHSGTLPLDGLMLRTAMRLDHPGRRDLRWLTEDFVYYLPFAGTWLSRAGGVRACPENAERLLLGEQVVAAFPEGIKGIGKPYRERYRLRRFGRGGFIRLALRTDSPLVPCAILGAEETAPLLGRVELGARLLRLPYFPITPTFPWLGPVGLIPAPTKWRMVFGEPIELGGGPAAAEDDVLVARLTERIRAGIQRMLDAALAQRKSVWFG